MSIYNFIAIGILCCCQNPTVPANANAGPSQKDELKKPPSTFQDTLIIDEVSVVFYQADSMQLENIKKVTEPRIFDSSMHEYFYQLRNAHSVLKQHWPRVKIIDSKNVRYLTFIKPDKREYVIDLNEYGDAYGMFMFDTRQAPMIADMANLDEALLYYSR